MLACERMFSTNVRRINLWKLRRGISKTSPASNNEELSSRLERKGAKLNPDSQMESKWINARRQNSTSYWSSIQLKKKPELGETPCFSKEELREFMAVFPNIVKDLTDSDDHRDIPDVTERFAKVLQYNVPNNENHLGLPTVVSYKALEKPENVTPENVMLANILGWCAEMLASSIIIVDDAMDKEPLRYGKTSWYQQNGVGMTAINDAFLVMLGIYTLLLKYLGGRKCCTYITKLFHDVATTAVMGQTMDMMSKAPDGTPRLDLFTMNRCKIATRYKVGKFYCLPTSLAMYLGDIFDPEEHRQAQRISMEIGDFFQLQNDFLDCFGNPKGTGKEGTDIREGKCTWLAVMALEKATPTQRKIMEDHYGKEDKKSVQRIKDLYLELNLPAIYATHEEELFIRIQTHIQQTYSGRSQELFLKLLYQQYNFKNTRLVDSC